MQEKFIPAVSASMNWHELCNDPREDDPRTSKIPAFCGKLPANIFPRKRVGREKGWGKGQKVRDGETWRRKDRTGVAGEGVGDRWRVGPFTLRRCAHPSQVSLQPPDSSSLAAACLQLTAFRYLPQSPACNYLPRYLLVTTCMQLPVRNKLPAATPTCSYLPAVLACSYLLQLPACRYLPVATCVQLPAWQLLACS